MQMPYKPTQSFRGDALTASRASVATLAIFASRRAAKTLVGEPPQTRLWDKMSQSSKEQRKQLRMGQEKVLNRFSVTFD